MFFGDSPDFGHVPNANNLPGCYRFAIVRVGELVLHNSIKLLDLLL